MSIPVQKSTLHLPLNSSEITDSDVECFLRDWLATWDEVASFTPQRYGRKGQKQKGIDLLASTHGGERWVVQVKRRTTNDWKKGDTEKAIRLAEDEYGKKGGFEKGFLWITADEDTHSIDYVSQLSGDRWKIHFLPDLSRLFRERSDDEDGARLLQTYFGSVWPRAFLNRSAVELTLQSVGGFFAPFLQSERSYFHHRLPLVAREAELDNCLDFLNDAQWKFGVFHGPPQVGKSRLLREAATNALAAEDPWEVRFVLDRPDAKDLERCGSRRLLFIVDDAHKADFLSAVVQLPFDSEGSKVLLVTRSQGLEDIRRTLSAHTELVREFDGLMPLAGEDLGRLVDVALEESAIESCPDSDRAKLVDLSADSALMAVAGAAVLEKQGVDGLRKKSSEFQRILGDNLIDEAAGKLSSKIERQTMRHFLEVVAAIQPIPAPGSDERVDGGIREIQELTKRDHEEVFEVALGIGVLVPAGSESFQISPDLLGELLLRNGCVGSAGATSLAKSVSETFGEYNEIAHFLFNVTSADAEGIALGEAWPTILHHFEETSSYRRRCRMLAAMGRVASLYPQKALELANLALSLPDQTVGEIKKESGWSEIKDVLEDQMNGSAQDQAMTAFWLIGEVMVRTNGYLTQCSEDLWRFGKDLPLPTNPYRHHPIRLLQKTLSFESWNNWKVFDETVVPRLKELWPWFSALALDPTQYGDRFTPLSLCEGVTEKSFTSWEGIPIAETKAIRISHAELLSKVILSVPLPHSLTAVQQLTNLASPPSGEYAKSLDKTAKHEWLETRKVVFAELTAALESTAEPLVRLRILRHLRWYNQYRSDDPLADLAREATVACQAATEFDLVRLAFSNAREEFPLASEVMGSSRDFSAEGQEKRKVEEKQQTEQWEALAKKEAHRWCGLFPDASTFLAALEDWAKPYLVADLRPNLGPLAWGVAETDPDLALAIAERILKNESSSLGQAFGYFAFQKAIPPTELSDLLLAAGRSGRADVEACVVGWLRSRTYLPQGDEAPGWNQVEWQVAEAIAQSPNVASRCGLLEAARWGEASPLAGCLELVEWGESSEVVEVIFSLFKESGADFVEFLPQAWVEEFFSHLIAHGDERLINKGSRCFVALGRSFPDTLARFLFAWVKNGHDIPDGVGGVLRDWQGDSKGPLLDEAFQLAVQVGAENAGTISRLIPILAGGMTENVMKRLQGLVAKDSVHCFDVLSSMLLFGRGNFVFAQHGFVADLLEALQRDDKESYKHALSSLSCGIGGIRQIIPGKASPVDVSIRDKAAELERHYAERAAVRSLYQSIRQCHDWSIRRDRERQGLGMLNE